MRPETFDSFVEMAVAGYAADNVASGRWSEQDAVAMSRAETERLLPQGLETPDNYLYEIQEESTEQIVGHVWFALVARGTRKVAFVYQVQVKPEVQRRGHAKAALLAVEGIAISLGMSGV